MDSVQPVACHLTQFHAIFAYPQSITVVSLITQQVVFSSHQLLGGLSDISFDMQSQQLILVCSSGPVMTARLLDDGVDAWK